MGMCLGIGLFIGAQGAVPDVPAAETTALLAAMTVQPDEAQAARLDTLIKAWKASGVWAALDVCYLHAQHTEQAALLNVKQPGTLTGIKNGAGCVFTQYRGFQGDGTQNNALNLLYNPTTNGVSFVRDSASLWAWHLTDVAENATDCGFSSGGSVTNFLSRSGAGQVYGYINSNSTFSVSVSSSLGLTGVQRRAANDVRVWRNGLQLGATISLASTGLTNWSLVSARGSKQVALTAVGGAMVGLENALYAPLLAYLQSVGAVP